jgi:lysophospholipase L1-like esterase
MAVDHTLEGSIMRRALSILLTVSVALLLISGTAAAKTAPSVYLALGDSLAWGDGASIPTRTGYVPRLDGYFQGRVGSTDLLNLAVRGENTGSFIAGQLGQAMASIANPSTDTAVVTLSVGGNDLGDLLSVPPCSADPTSPDCQFAVYTAMVGVSNNFPVILGSLQAALAADPGDEKLFVITYWNTFGGTASPFEVPIDFALLGSDLTIDCAANQVDPSRVGLNDLLACIGMALGAVVVDLYPVFGDDALTYTHIAEGDIHPNDDGYALIAQAHRQADRAP